MRRFLALFGCALLLVGVLATLSTDAVSAAVNSCNSTPTNNACHATGGLSLRANCQTGYQPSFHFVINSVDGTPPSTLLARFNGSSSYVSGSIGPQGNILAANIIAPAGTTSLQDAYFVRPSGFTYGQFNLSGIACVQSTAPTDTATPTITRTPTTTRTPTATRTSTPTATATASACPTGTAAISQYSYLVNGSQNVSDLGNAGVVNSGDTVRVNFLIAAGCTNVQVSLVSYTAPAAVFSYETADQQRVYQQATGYFGAGWHNLIVQIPSCFFQIDFVTGPVIEQLGPSDSNNFYGRQNRLIDSDNGGTTLCKSTPTPTRTPSPTATPPGTKTPTPTPSITATTTTRTPTPTSVPSKNVCDNSPQPSSCHVTGGLDLTASCPAGQQAVYHFIVNQISGPPPDYVYAVFNLADGSTRTVAGAVGPQGAILATRITAPDGATTLRDAYFVRPGGFVYANFNLSSIECSTGTNPPPPPTPELDSFILFGVGGAGLGAYLFRQRRQRRGRARQ